MKSRIVAAATIFYLLLLAGTLHTHLHSESTGGDDVGCLSCLLARTFQHAIPPDPASYFITDGWIGETVQVNDAYISLVLPFHSGRAPPPHIGTFQFS